MKNKSLKATRISALDKGKTKGIGFFESIPLRIIGRNDGKHGLPRETDGKWLSACIEKEIRSYDEFTSRMWGKLQFEEEAHYARLEELMNSLIHTKVQLDNAEKDFAEAKAFESVADNSRKNGENKLTEAQVAARRAKESKKRLAPVKNKVSDLQTKLISEIDEFSALRAKIIEDNNSTRMVCNRVRDHLYQRLAVYWNSALRNHSDSKKMPVTPCVDIIFNSEDIYMKPHYKVLMEKAELLSEITSIDKQEAE